MYFSSGTNNGDQVFAHNILGRDAGQCGEFSAHVRQRTRESRTYVEGRDERHGANDREEHDPGVSNFIII